jgi:hypothetical protein
MVTHICSKEREINRIVEVIDGNGKPGLRDDVTSVKTELAGIKGKLNDIDMNVSSLLRFQTEISTTEHLRDKVALSQRQRATVIVAGIVGLSSVIIAIINALT